MSTVILDRPAAIGHNSASVGEMIKAEPAVVYRDETVLPSLLSEIRAEIDALPVNLSTVSGREAIASLAASISRRKTPIIAAGLALTEGWREQTKAVNTLKAKVEAEMNALRDLARTPLTEWESAEEKRKERIVSTLKLFAQAAVVPACATVESIDLTIERVASYQIGHEFGDSEKRAKEEQFAALGKLKEARAAVVKADAERAELEAFRAADLERERAAQQAEAKRLADEAERERIASAERRATEAAEAKAKAEADAAIAAERRKVQEAEDALAAERARQEADAAIAAERRKVQEAEDALAAERARQEAARAAEERRLRAIAEEDARRQADQEHRGSVMRSAKEALMEHGGIDEATAKKVVLAIAAGSVPSVTISF
jgi:colicin import membrane protein